MQPMSLGIVLVESTCVKVSDSFLLTSRAPARPRTILRLRPLPRRGITTSALTPLAQAPPRHGLSVVRGPVLVSAPMLQPSDKVHQLQAQLQSYSVAKANTKHSTQTGSQRITQATTNGNPPCNSRARNSKPPCATTANWEPTRPWCWEVHAVGASTRDMTSNALDSYRDAETSKRPVPSSNRGLPSDRPVPSSRPDALAEDTARGTFLDIMERPSLAPGDRMCRDDRQAPPRSAAP